MAALPMKSPYRATPKRAEWLTERQGRVIFYAARKTSPTGRVLVEATR